MLRGKSSTRCMSVIHVVPFSITPEISCSVSVRDEESEKTSVKTKKISISLMSSTKDACGLIEFVDGHDKSVPG